MVPFTNVTFTVRAIGQAKLSDNTLDNPSLGTPDTGIKGYLEEWDANEVFDEYNLRLVNPAILQINVPDAVAFGADNWVEAEVSITASKGAGSYVGRVYKVHGRGDWHDDGLPADHVSFLMDRMTYPL